VIQSGPREATARSRKISQLDSSHRDGRLPDEGYLKLDSHADTACVGADCNAIHYIEHSCEVSPFHPGYEPLLDVPIVQTTTAYTDPENGKTYILIINETLPLGDALGASYLNPNQMRAHGLVVNNTPHHLASIPSTATHSIFIPLSNLWIPLTLKGIVSGIITHYPSMQELENCEWVELTSPEPWEPSSQIFKEREVQLQPSMDEELTPVDRHIVGVTSRPFKPRFNLFPFNLQCKINTFKTQPCTHSCQLRNKVSTVFGIGLETAERTLQVTTHLALRNAIHPIHRRFRTEVAQFCYPRLGEPHRKFHMNTFFASQPSLSRCTMGQMYTNNVHFTKFYPMHRKSDAPDTLLQFMQDIGIPSELHSDDAKLLIVRPFVYI